MDNQNLTSVISNLLDWASKELDVPSYSQIKIADSSCSAVAGNDPALIPIDARELYDVDEFKSRYQSLLKKGYGWLNFQCAGIYKGDLIVVVEYPTNYSNTPHVQINFSGPYKTQDGETLEWQFENRFEIV